MNAHGGYVMPCRVLSYMYLTCGGRMRLLTHGINICHAWAFCVVRLDDLGNARASTSGMGKGESHAFIFVET